MRGDTVEMLLVREHSSIIHSLVVHYLYDLTDHRQAQRQVLDEAIADVDILIRRTTDPAMKAAFETTRSLLEHLTHFSADDMPKLDHDGFHHPVYQAVYRLREMMSTCSQKGPSIAYGLEVGTNPCRPEQWGLKSCLTTLGTSLTMGELWKEAKNLRNALQEHVHLCAGCPYRLVEAHSKAQASGPPKPKSPWFTGLLKWRG